jgi:DNA-binding transcriptional LysR family regulator
MHPQQLAYVVAVAEHRHFTRAAEELSVSQPSLSAAIRTLEAELGAPLFHRVRGDVSLTPAGEALLPIAKRVLADLDAARQEVAALVQLRSGQVRVGATPSLCTGLLPEVLGQFRRRYPGIALSLREGGSRDLVRWLDAGDLDLALVILPLAPRDRGLEAQPVLREDLVLAMADSLRRQLAPAAALGPVGQPVPIERLRGLPLLAFRRGYDLRAALEDACARAGFEPTLVVEGGEMDALVRLAEAGVGACLLPITVARRSRLVTYPVADEQMSRTIGVARRRGVSPFAAVRALRRVLDEYLHATPMPDGIELVVESGSPAHQGGA